MLPVKTDLPQGLSRLCPGARRSFFCRMKYRSSPIPNTDGSDTSSGSYRRTKQINSSKKYITIHCTGYLKSWSASKIGIDEQETEGDGESCNLPCLVAVGRIPPNIIRTSSVATTTTTTTTTTASSTSPPPINRKPPNLRSVQFLSRHTMDGKFLFVDQGYLLNIKRMRHKLRHTHTHSRTRCSAA